MCAGDGVEFADALMGKFMALLSSYEKLSQDQLETLWREGLFVFDTSLLLNLHRYRDNVRDDFIKAMGQIQNQIWIPFQVALEYERNRPKVVADKRRLIEKAKGKVASLPGDIRSQLSELGAFRRHSHIDAEDFLQAIQNTTETFCQSLERLALATPDITHEDAVRAKIEELFSGRIGDPPASQNEVQKIDEAASSRFSVGCPPGYLDQDKDTGRDSSAYSYAGLVYQRKNGDLYLWEQIKKKALADESRAVCLVTDDQKEDWWWIVDAEGKKRLGPRPELREELFRESKVEIFSMYGPDSFLEAMNRYRHTGIQQDTISEAREVSLERRRLKFGAGPFGHRARLGVERWCMAKSVTGKVFESEFPDFIELDADDAIVGGFEVIPVIAPLVDVEQRVQRRAEDIFRFIANNPAADLRLLFVFKGQEEAMAQIDQIREFADLPSGVIRCVGYMSGRLYKHLKCFVDVAVSDGINFG